MPLKKTPLYERHRAAGARLVDFAGYAMPIQYTGILAEHRTVRGSVGMFDVSHMGEIEVAGPQALDFLDYLLPNRVRALAVNQVLYTPMCAPDGGTVDDLLVYRLADRYLLVVNAANATKDFRWVQKHASGFEVTVEDQSDRFGQLAVQGPQAGAALERALELELATLGYYWATRLELFGEPVLVSRTGYTGEDGFELYASARATVQLWDALVEAGVSPIGLGARDSLRFEACLPLYGHELGRDTSPLEAGLGWTVKDKPGDYLGKVALLRQREAPPRRLLGLRLLDPGVPRQGYPVLHGGGPIGAVTSGMKAPSLEEFLALALVTAELAVGSEVEVEIRGMPKRAEVVKRPFYRGSVRRG